MKSTSKMFGAFLGGLVLVVFALTGYAEEICVQPPTGLVSWWPGDGNADDIIGGHDGVLVGAMFAPGIVGQAFSFNAANTFVDFGTPASLQLNDPFTIDLWFNKSAFVSFAYPALIAAGTNGWVLGIYDDIGGEDRLFVSKSTQPPYMAGATALNNNQWYHAAVVRSGSSTILYLNGAVEGTSNSSPTFMFSTAFRLAHDSSPAAGSHTFLGLIDEVEVYNRALSAAEILGIFNAGSAGKCKVTTVAIDIKPGSFPNSVNLNSAGVVPVAILSSATFDATQVDLTTVALAGAAVKLIGKGDKYACRAEDVNADGLLDLACQVVTAQFMIEPGDSVAVLEAKTLSGQAIRGEDSINIVP